MNLCVMVHCSIRFKGGWWSWFLSVCRDWCSVRVWNRYRRLLINRIEVIECRDNIFNYLFIWIFKIINIIKIFENGCWHKLFIFENWCSIDIKCSNFMFSFWLSSACLRLIMPRFNFFKGYGKLQYFNYLFDNGVCKYRR